MKKVMIWLGAGLITLGVALFLAVSIFLNFDYTRLQSMKYTTNSYEITQQFHSVDLDTITADIKFLPSEDGKCRVICFEREKVSHDVSVKDGTLVISAVDNRNWLDHLSIINLETPTVTVYLPEDQYQALKVKNTTGDVKVCGKIELGTLSVETTTGDVCAEGMICKGDLLVHVTTGDTYFENITCKNLNVNGSTGKTALKNVIAFGDFRIHRTTGDIKLDQCDANNLYIDATTGSVKGTLLTPKVIFAKSTTGDVDVPKYTTGGRCEIDTTTGDICINIP